MTSFQIALNINMGWFLFFFLSLMPVFLWVLEKPLNLLFSNFFNTFTSIGQIAGLVGMAMFALNIMLTSRLKILENLFYALNKVYKVHHFIGGMVLILLLIHPISLAIRYVPISLKTAALFLLPGSDLAINFGIFALLSLILLLVLTFFIILPYHIWNFTHKFLGLALFLGGLHVFFVSSDVSSNLILRTYMFTLITIALISYLYRSIFFDLFNNRFTYTVEKVNNLAKNIIEIELIPSADLRKNLLFELVENYLILSQSKDFSTRPPSARLRSKSMQYLPGQFIFITFKNNNLKNETHPFSISSSPTEQNLKITVKILGDYTAKLIELKPKTLAKIEGPFGKFSFLNFKNKNQIWIAGGIGITPFFSMSKTLKDHKDYKIDLYYSVKDKDEAVYLDDLLELSKKGNFRIIPWFTKKQGRLSLEAIKNKSGDLNNKEILICGPLVMMRAFKSQLHKTYHIPYNIIHTEEFGLS